MFAFSVRSHAFSIFEKDIFVGQFATFASKIPENLIPKLTVAPSVLLSLVEYKIVFRRGSHPHSAIRKVLNAHVESALKRRVTLKDTQVGNFH